MDAPLLTREQSRQIDRIAIDEYGIPGIVLMENAGRGVVDVLTMLGIDGPVLILCGGGNNGGDGFVIARHLAIRGAACRVVTLVPAEKLTGDALTNFRILQKCDVPIVEFADADTDAAWIVDAMLGTGARGEPRPPLPTVIKWMNAQPAKKMAIDVPSGLDCDTGQPAEHTVRANQTCTFVAKKQGFAAPGASEFTGEVHVVEIGTPPRLLRELAK